METQESSTMASRSPSSLEDPIEIVNLDVAVDYDFEPVESASTGNVEQASRQPIPSALLAGVSGAKPNLPPPHPKKHVHSAGASRLMFPTPAQPPRAKSMASSSPNRSASTTPRTRSPTANVSAMTTPSKTSSPSVDDRVNKQPDPEAPTPGSSRRNHASGSGNSDRCRPSPSGTPRPTNPVPSIAQTPAAVAETCASITWIEATTALRNHQADLWRLRTAHPQFERVSPAGLRIGGRFSCCWSLFNYDITEGSPHWDERDFILGLAQTPVAYTTNSIHRRVLMSVWRLLQGQYYSTRRSPESPSLQAGAAAALPVPSLNWVVLGFSDADPTADFRHVGAFGLYQLLFISQHRSQLANALFRLSRCKTHRFPFGQIAMAFSGVVVQLLKDRELNQLIREASESNDPRNAVLSSLVSGSVDITSVLNALYCGLWYRFHEEWSGIAQRQPTDSVTPTLKELLRDVRASPKTFAALDSSATDFLKVHRNGLSVPTTDAKAAAKGTFYALS